MTSATRIVEYDSSDDAHALLRDIVATDERVIACACADVTAFMRDAMGFPHEGIPASDDWPELTRRAGEFMAAPGRVLVRAIETPLPVDELVDSLVGAAADAGITDVLVMLESSSEWNDEIRARTVALADQHDVQVHVSA